MQGNKTFWYCNEEPRMIHQADIDTATGAYMLGNIWNEPHTHGRNSHYDYFAAYGDLEPRGGAFGLRFSGHHIDLDFKWDDQGTLVDDLPVFLGHNPLIVPAMTPHPQRKSNEKAHPEQFCYPLMWTNMAGVAQFEESEQLVLECANQLLTIAPASYVPLNNWVSTGYIGALSIGAGKGIADFDYFDLSTASDAEFQTMWNLVAYTLKFARGNRATTIEQDTFRSQGKAIWTTSSPPEEGLPLTEEDLRTNLNFLNLRIETDDWLFFVMVNQLYTGISEKEPTNHLHSILIQKELISADNVCVETGDPLCVAPPLLDAAETPPPSISNVLKYESLLWEERNLKGNASLDLDAFDKGLRDVSEAFCGMGITATLFDANAQQVYQNTVGSKYDGFSGEYLNYASPMDDWTGDTTMSLFSNSKVLGAATFLASVVDQGLGSLDEPIYLTFPEFLSKDDIAGNVTPRMILSHTSGLLKYDREKPTSDPYFFCVYDSTKTAEDCLGAFLLNGTIAAPHPQLQQRTVRHFGSDSKTKDWTRNVRRSIPKIHHRPIGNGRHLL